MRFVLILTIGNCLPETSPFFVCPNGFGFSYVYSTLGKSLKVIDSAGGYPNGKTQLLPLNPLKMFIYWL